MRISLPFFFNLIKSIIRWDDDEKNESSILSHMANVGILIDKKYKPVVPCVHLKIIDGIVKFTCGIKITYLDSSDRESLKVDLKTIPSDKICDFLAYSKDAHLMTDFDPIVYLADIPDQIIKNIAIELRRQGAEPEVEDVLSKRRINEELIDGMLEDYEDSRIRFSESTIVKDIFYSQLQTTYMDDKFITDIISIIKYIYPSLTSSPQMLFRMIILCFMRKDIIDQVTIPECDHTVQKQVKLWKSIGTKLFEQQVELSCDLLIFHVLIKRVSWKEIVERTDTVEGFSKLLVDIIINIPLSIDRLKKLQSRKDILLNKSKKLTLYEIKSSHFVSIPPHVQEYTCGYSSTESHTPCEIVGENKKVKVSASRPSGIIDTCSMKTITMNTIKKSIKEMSDQFISFCCALNNPTSSIYFLTQNDDIYNMLKKYGCDSIISNSGIVISREMIYRVSLKKMLDNYLWVQWLSTYIFVQKDDQCLGFVCSDILKDPLVCKHIDNDFGVVGHIDVPISEGWVEATMSLCHPYFMGSHTAKYNTSYIKQSHGAVGFNIKGSIELLDTTVASPLMGVHRSLNRLLDVYTNKPAHQYPGYINLPIIKSQVNAAVQKREVVEKYLKTPILCSPGYSRSVNTKCIIQMSDGTYRNLLCDDIFASNNSSTYDKSQILEKHLTNQCDISYIIKIRQLQFENYIEDYLMVEVKDISVKTEELEHSGNKYELMRLKSILNCAKNKYDKTVQRCVSNYRRFIDNYNYNNIDTKCFPSFDEIITYIHEQL